MADPITIGLAAAGLLVAGVTAVANMASAFSQYRTNHPRKTQTGRVDNYTATHQGYSMLQPQLYPAPDPYAAFMNMGPSQSQPQPQPQPQPQHSYYNYAQQPSIQGFAPQSKPSYQPPASNSPSFYQQHFPVTHNLVKSLFGSPSKAHVQRSNSTPTHHTPLQYQDTRLSSSQHGPSHGSQHGPGRGGWITLYKEQQSRDTLRDTNIGMHTGREPGYTLEMARAHWYKFQSLSLDGAGTIAVVNWSERSIGMYVYSQSFGQYFLNYSVSHFDLEAFRNFYSSYHVFFGILKNSWLVSSNDDLKVVEDDSWCGVKSSNCWNLLGIQGHTLGGELVFVEMQRAALFGLIQCRSMDPALLNVDMVGDQRVQFVHVDTQYLNLQTKGDCCFSVFSFGTNGWAEQRVLVG